MIRAAGCLIVAKSTGNVLFLCRNKSGDMPGTWCLPGGKLEEGEDAIDAALRETLEEAPAWKGSFKPKKSDLEFWTSRIWPSEATGSANLVDKQSGPQGTTPSVLSPNGTGVSGVPLPPVVEPVHFTTFKIEIANEYLPDAHASGEHDSFAWASPSNPPQPLHPGCDIALRKLAGMDELALAKAIQAGELTSPQFYENIALFAVRITGTEQAVRSRKTDDKGNVIQEEEVVWRDPSIYLNPEFIERCNGIPVVLEHPPGMMLDTKEFRDRSIGAIMRAYQLGNEIWGIARVYDAPAAKMMTEHQLSTSPSVVWNDTDVNQSGTLKDGRQFLIEGKPSLLDHLAVCWQGVWDKGGDPKGIVTVRGDQEGDVHMTKEELEKALEIARADNEKLNKTLNATGEVLKTYQTRQDSLDNSIKELLKERASDKALAFRFPKIDKANKETPAAYATRMDSAEGDLKALLIAAGADDKVAATQAKQRRVTADAEEDDKEAKKDSARKRMDAFKFSKRRKDDDDDTYKKRHDEEEKQFCADAEEAGEEKEKAAADAARRRKDAEEEDKKEAKDDDDDDDDKAHKKDDDDDDDDKSRKDRRRARHDSVSRKDFDDLKAQLEATVKPLTDAELNERGKILLRADEVYTALGQPTPVHRPPESLLTLRRRIAGDLKQFTRWKGSELSVVAADEEAFKNVENDIYEEALKHARSPATVKPGELRKRVIRKDSMHMHIEWDGVPSSWMQPLGGSVGQAVKAFNLPNNSNGGR